MAVGTMTSIRTWVDVVAFVKSQIPRVLTTGKFNFITIHYCYILGLTIVFSVLVYVIGGMAYIDALFFASGACTQSGLNTVNVNDIATSQQALLYAAAMFCNPIVIHSSVVFIRLYWFEKRFEDVVKEARSLRRTKSRSRDPTIIKEDLEAGDDETGVKGKAIKLLRQTGRKFSLPGPTDKESVKSESEDPDLGRRFSQDEKRRGSRSRHQGSFQSMDTSLLPQQMNTEQHIRFLENQRNPVDDVTLRIPSPREFDRGGRPQDVRTQSDDHLQRQDTRYPEKNDEGGNVSHQAQIATHLTFNEPEIVRDRPRTGNLPPRLNQRRTGTTGSRLSGTNLPSGNFSSSSLRRSNTAKTTESMPYLSYQPTVGRNSFFINLTEEQREELGGIEYRALKTLALVLIFYFFAFHFLGIIMLTPWIYHTSYGAIVTGDGQGRGWWGVFTAGSAFNDLGFTLTPDSMNSFGSSSYALLLMTFLIIIGNTGFPCMLRFMIWLFSKMASPGSGLWEELHFLLDHPRRCFTLLFPRSATWWLTAILVILNGVDLIFFVILDLKDPAVTVLSGWEKFLDGLFQAASTRTAGFSVVNLAALHPGIQVSYLIMMYISVFPIAISMRRTNVYEEKSLGIYGSAAEEDDEEGKEPSYVGAHLRKQLSFDLWYIFLGLFIIAIVEGNRLQNTNEYAFTIFSVLFEIVSAYGTVGLSLGYPGIDASFSAEFHVLSKLVIIAMQIRGRHRGLPYELDRAVLLPSESLHEKEKRDAERLLQRRPSLAMSMNSAVDGQMESEKFRSETGLSSAIDHEDFSTVSRERRSTNRARSNSFHDNKSGPARRELGVAMFKLSNAPDILKQEIASGSSSSDS